MGFLDSVKGVAGKFGESVERGAKTVSNKSKEFAEKTKVKREIANIEQSINADYIELGKALYDKICNEADSEYVETVTDIKEKNQKLAELKAALMSLDDKVFCTNCGAPISKDQAFCDKCGQKTQDIAASNETEEPAKTEVIETTATTVENKEN